MGSSKANTKTRSRRERPSPRAVDAGPSGSDTRVSPPVSPWTWIVALGVFALTWAVFRPALDGQWLRWDDDQLLLEREEWRGFDLERLRWMATTFHMGPYQPLSWLSYAFDHARAGLDPRAYHATNLALHATSAVLLFFLARRLFTLALERSRTSGADATRGSLPTAWLEAAAAASALAWALHPQRVESVAWITERRDCLAGVFFLATLLAWLSYASGTTHRRRAYAVAVLCFAASLLSKGLGLVLPLVLWVLDVWPTGRWQALRESSGSRTFGRWIAWCRETWPFLALSAAAAVLAFVGQGQAGAIVRGESHGFGARVVVAFHGLAFYVRKTLWPDDLMVLVPMQVPFDATEARFVVSIVLVLVVAVLLVLARRRVPAVVAACASYALLVSPVLGLVQVGSQLAADRYAYLPTLPLFLLLGGGVALVLRRAFAADATRRGLFLAGTTLAVVGTLSSLAWATRRQIPVWHDTSSLWRHDLSVDPADNPARRNLLAEYQVLGRAEADPARRRALFEKGLEEFRAGDALAPDPVCLVHAAKLCDLLAGEQPEEAQRHLEAGLAYALRAVERARATGRRLADAHESAAVLSARLGRAAEAVPHFEALVALEPGRASAQGMLGEALMQVGRNADALEPLLAARRLDPASTTILLDLGDVQRSLGRIEEAAAAYRSVLEARRAALGPACAQDPDHQAAFRALVEMGRTP